MNPLLLMRIPALSVSALFRLAFLPLLLASMPLSGADSPAAPAKSPANASVKLLTIGNSFTQNALQFLPKLAKAGGKQLLVFPANLGGHSLQQHASYVQAFEADPNDPKGHAYKGQTDPRTGKKKDFSLREALESQDWNIVTIQQVSGLSYKPESFQPYANTLISYIRKYAPHAEILIYQTWAYPDDYFPKFQEKNLDQQTMFAGIKTAYQKLADDTGLQIIPVGDAFQAIRALPDHLSLNVAGDKHANMAGCYLAAATFYEMIFGENVAGNTFVPAGLSAGDAQTLRRAAHAAVANEAQHKSAHRP